MSFVPTSRPLSFQSTPSNVERNVAKSMQPATIYPRSPYALSGLRGSRASLRGLGDYPICGSPQATPGGVCITPPNADACQPMDYYQLAAAFGVVTCDQPDVPGQYACSQRNVIAQQALANSGLQYSTCISPSQLPGGSNFVPNVPYNPSTGAYNPAPGSPAGGQTSIQPPTTSGGSSSSGGGVYIAPAPVPGAGSVSMIDPANGQSLNNLVLGIGQAYQIRIAGAAPNTQVTAVGTQNGVTLAGMSFGSTDGSGNFSYSGTLGSGTQGTWHESWYVGGNALGTISFTVTNSAPATGGSGTPPAGTGGGTGGAAGGGQTTSGPGSTLSNLLGGTPLITGISNSTLLLGAGGLVVLMMLTGGRR